MWPCQGRQGGRQKTVEATTIPAKVNAMASYKHGILEFSKPCRKRQGTVALRAFGKRQGTVARYWALL